MMSLFRPGETVRDVSAWGSVPRTIGTKACPDEVGELSYCLDIAQNGIVESLEVLRACEQESRHSAQSTHLVTLLEQFYVICFGDLERHREREMDEKDKTRMESDRVELIAGARDSKSSSQPSDPAWQSESDGLSKA